MLVAVERGDADLVRRLLSYGPAARATNRRGQMPLAIAAIRNDGAAWVEIARALVNAGAPLDARDGDGLTALGHAEMRAVRTGGKHGKEMVEFLLRAGADPAASRFALTVGGRSVALDHRALTTAGCRPPPGTPSCDAARALARGTTRGLARAGGANPGALVCEQVGGDTAIARHASGDEDAVCEFPDGSVVLAGRLYEAALQNDLRRQ
jgi:putative hemolysin